MYVLCWKLAEKRDFREYGVMLGECGTMLSELWVKMTIINFNGGNYRKKDKIR